jgi:MoxR-like ATPase
MPKAPKDRRDSADRLTLSSAQQDTLTAARAWWQEGERALDYLAERARHETTVHRLRDAFDALRAEREPTAGQVAPILPLARQLSANRALNRTLETDNFARALRALLYGDDPLPARLAAILATHRIGPQTVSHLLYAAFPDRFPLVSDTTRTILAPIYQQRAAARREVTAQYGLTDETPREIHDLLADFALYEAARRLLALSDFVDLNAILWHAREMPKPTRKRAGRVGTARVRETKNGYGTESEPLPAPEPTEADLLAYIEGYIAAQGFTFPPLTVRNYYIALKAKPFVILTGLSGTGKTRLTRLFADALTGGTRDQYLLLPVRPDWTDGTPLLGYHNLVTDRYVSTPFLDTLMLAARTENRERAFFLCLDEMNLARVEHYFSDMLSAMETPDRRIPLHEGRSAVLPSNVFLTGSVNMDEATHPFSRKVLDRANTIEFTDVRIGGGLGEENSGERTVLPEIPPAERQRLFLASGMETVGEALERLRDRDPAFPDRAVSLLTDLNERLTPRGLHFGYRVRDEALRYAAASFASDSGAGLLNADLSENLTTALDLQIVQKVLPRLSGTAEALERLLSSLEAWAREQGFPRTAAKLARMRTHAAEDGIVTFYEL